MTPSLPALPRPTRGGTYLRAVVTARCPLSCSYCHQEGDPASPRPNGLDTEDWISLLQVGLDCGVRKLKLVGGEPLVRSDLPEIVRPLRRRAPDADISVVTSGAVPARALERLFDAGLSRCNVTMHGFRLEDFARRGGTARQHAGRADFLAAALLAGRPLKINYVYTGPECEPDLAALLEWAASRPCTVSVLDDLSRPDLDHGAVLEALDRVSGAPIARWDEPDEHSLHALRLRYFSGAVVEVKDRRLGDAAPWSSCAVCLRRALCREGIVALRLTHVGELRPCMDRSDLGLSLLPILRAQGCAAVQEAWIRWLSDLSPTEIGS